MPLLRTFEEWCQNALNLVCVHICQRLNTVLLGLCVLVILGSHAMLCIFEVMQGIEVALSYHPDT